MRITLLLLSYCLILTTASAQDVYPLHPSVGDTIDLTEKLDYSLFSEIENKGFQHAVIVFREGNFVLLVKTDSINEKESESEYAQTLEQESIITEQQKIQKINAYYRYLAEEAKKPKTTPLEQPNNQRKYPIRVEGAMSEKMKKEARMLQRLKEDNRRMQEFEMGLRPRDVRIEFK